jgi:hypothetical protein
METYIVIISAPIGAITIAYKIATNIKSIGYIPIVKMDGDFGISFPVGVPNDVSVERNVDLQNLSKIYLKVKEINSLDINNFNTISNQFDWQSILDNILNKIELTKESYLSDIKLFNDVVIECKVESTPSIMAEIQFNTYNNIKIITKS